MEYTVDVNAYNINLPVRGIVSVAWECYSTDVTLSDEIGVLVFTFPSKEYANTFCKIMNRSMVEKAKDA